MSLFSDLLTSMFSPSSQEGYDQGYALGTNQPVSKTTGAPVASPMAQAMSQTPGPMSPQALAALIANGQGQSYSPALLAAMSGNGDQCQGPQGPSVSTPMSQAMAAATQPPQTASTPISQAMGPQPSTPTAISDAMTGTAPATPIQAALQNQATNPKLALNNSLIAAGSALLGNKDPASGLADAASSFSNTYDKTLDQQRDLNTPKVTPLADGAFSMVQMPGQSPQVLPSTQVQQFLIGKQQLINQAGLNKTVLQGNIRAQQQQAQDDRKNADQYQGALTQTDTALGANQRALAVARNQAQNSPIMSKVEGAFPGISQTLGLDDAAGNLVIQRAHIDTALVQDALKKGAITDAQAGFLNSDIPSASASREKVIIPFLEQQQDILQRIRNFQASQVAKANPTAPQGFATSGTSNTGGSPQATQSTGSGSYQPVAVADKASYDALPSGTVFKAPDGSVRRKQ